MRALFHYSLNCDLDVRGATVAVEEVWGVRWEAETVAWYELEQPGPALRLYYMHVISY